MVANDQQIIPLYKYSRLLTIIAGGIFLLGIPVWLFVSPGVTEINSGWNAIRPLTALSGILLSLANFLLLRSKSRLGRVRLPVIIVMVFAGLSFTDWALGPGSMLEDYLSGSLLFGPVKDYVRMGCMTSLLLIITSIALFFGNSGTKNIKRSQFTALLVLYLCFFIILGYILRSAAMTSVEGVFAVPLHLILGIIALNLAILFRTAEQGIIRFYLQKSPAVQINLRLLFQTIGLLLAIAWLRFEGEEFGLYNSRLGLPIMVAVFIAVLAIVISRSASRLSAMERRNARLIDRLEAQKTQFELILNRTNDGIYMLDKNLVITYANPNALRTVNKPEDAVVGYHVSSLFADPEVAANYIKTFEKSFALQEPLDTEYHTKQYNRWFTNTIFPSPDGITIFYKELTEQKLAEIEVKEARDHFKSLVENLKDVVIRLNPGGEITYISPADAGKNEQVKEKLAEWLKQSVRRNPANQKLNGLLPTHGGSQHLTTAECIITGDGEEQLFEVRYSAEYDASGEHVSFLAICRDITESVRVRDEKGRLASIIHNVTSMVCQADENLQVTYVNPAGRRMLGLPAEGPFNSLHLSNFCPPDQAKLLRQVACPVALQKGTWMGESAVLNGAGELIPVMLIMVVHRDKQGQFSYLSVVGYDLSQIKQTETALRESEKRWQFAVDGSNLGLWDWNINNNKIFYSKRWKAMLGYSEHEIGTDPSEFELRVHPEDRKMVMNKLNDYFQGVHPHYDCVYQMQKKDGSFIYIRDRGMITDFNNDGSPSRMIGTYSDISIQHKQAQMLEKSREELRLLAVHLQNIREEERFNLSRMMQEELGQQLSSLKMDFSSFENQELLADRDIRNKLSKAQRTLEETIQVVKKISTDLRPSILEDLGLVASLQSLTQDFRMRFDIRIRFSSMFENMETSPKTALCFYRVYQEALSNIARHSLARQVAVRLTISENGELILAVKDDGIGFNMYNHSFERNVGLVEVRERMHMINGELKITSTPGKGTLLLVKAPMRVEV